MSKTRDLKRKKIISAARELFDQNGYNTSMDSIAKLADVSKQTLYAHFKKKDSLFQCCMQENVREYLTTNLTFDYDLPIENVLFGFAQALHIKLQESGPVYTYRNAVSQIENHPEYSETYLEHGPERTLTELTEYLDKKVKDGTIQLEIPTENAAIQLLLMFHGKAVYWLYLGADIKQTTEQRDSYLKSCVNMFLNQAGYPGRC